MRLPLPDPWNQLLALAFAVAGVLIVVFHRRLAEAFRASNRAFYGSLIGDQRVKRLEPDPASTWGRFNRAWERWFLVFFGSAWTAFGLIGLIAPVRGLGD